MLVKSKYIPEPQPKPSELHHQGPEEATFLTSARGGFVRHTEHLGNGDLGKPVLRTQSSFLLKGLFNIHMPVFSSSQFQGLNSLRKGTQ
jgi:hypothetical protein